MTSTTLSPKHEVIRLLPRRPYEAMLPPFGAPHWETFGSPERGPEQALASDQTSPTQGQLSVRGRQS